MVHMDDVSPAIRLTTGIAADTDPVWSQDGRQIVFRSMQRGRPEVFSTRAAITPVGSGEPAARVVNTDGEVPTDWRTGEMLVQRRGKSGFDLIRLDEATGATTPIAATPFNETDARRSPDGRWIAYVSDEPGQPEIHVVSDRGDRRRVSPGGGTHPRWTRDGRALLFLRGSMLMRMTRSGERFESPQPLVEVPGVRDFDVAHRSDRILALLPVRTDPVDTVSVILNWRSLLPGRGPQK
jgi:serine/threonine-protein kinase